MKGAFLLLFITMLKNMKWINTYIPTFEELKWFKMTLFDSFRLAGLL